MRPRTVAVVQARNASSRLAHKVLLDLDDRPLIDWVVGRVRRADKVDQVVVATTTDRSDDVLFEHCADAGYPVVRGSSGDVLDRVVTAAASERADVVVRIFGHMPLIDPDVVDEVIGTHLDERRDYTANRLPEPQPHAYPPGLDVEVASMSALTEAWTARASHRHRESVTAYLYETPGRFNVRIVAAPVPVADTFWAIETGADLAAVRALVDVARATLTTSWFDLLGVWRRHPEVAAMNPRTGPPSLAV